MDLKSYLPISFQNFALYGAGSSNPEAESGILQIDYRALLEPFSYTIKRKGQAPGPCQLW